VLGLPLLHALKKTTLFKVDKQTEG
jgi:hypothetical protein